MSCERYRDKIVEALASGEAAQGVEVATHLSTCDACREFLEEQMHLFSAVDSGLRKMANESVPASLLPAVRAEAEATSGAVDRLRVSWAIPVGVVALIAIGFCTLRYAELGPFGIPDPAVVTVRPLEPSSAAGETVRNSIGASAKLVPREIKSPAKRETMPEVIVLVEEREAYEKYVRGIPAGNVISVQPDRPLEPLEIASQAIPQLHFRTLALGSLADRAEE